MAGDGSTRSTDSDDASSSAAASAYREKSPYSATAGSSNRSGAGYPSARTSVPFTTALGPSFRLESS
ncbi:hypothetical protein [Haloterrigena salinisoli]|uniref:hypothetical protein n=1 Tax=Haloterrigena salinisoli TaxID=3132747 RepID=UPI0030CF85C6